MIMAPEKILENWTFTGVLGKFFRQFFRHKIELGHILTEAKKQEEKRLKEESKRAREDAKNKKEAEEKGKPYQERESEQTKVQSLEQARRIHLEKVKEKLRQFLNEQGKTGSGYLFELVRDTAKQEKIFQLLDKSDVAANLFEELVTKGRELHDNPAALINLGRRLLYEAEVVNMKDAVSDLLSEIKERALALIPKYTEAYNKNARMQGGQETNAPIWLINELETDMSLPDDIKDKLQDQRHPHLWQEAIEELFSQTYKRTPTEDISWVKKHEEKGIGDDEVPAELANEVSQIMQKVRQAEEAGFPLEPRQLQEAYHQLLAAESRYHPPNLVAGSTAFFKEYYDAHQFVEERMKTLAKVLQERLKMEIPDIPTGITDPRKFIEAMGTHKGRLGDLVEKSPRMKDLLLGHVPPDELERSIRFRNQVFLTVHSKVLSDPQQSSGQNFGLYERADFDSLLELLRTGLDQYRRPESGQTYGEAWTQWYINLSNTILFSRDIDFWAAQPGVNIDDWAKSFALFHNSNSALAMLIPAAEKAYRAYEDTLLSFRESNDGYIQPGLVDYRAAGGYAAWDNLSKLVLKNMINAGVVPDMARDPYSGFHQVEKNGTTIKEGKALDLNKMREFGEQGLELELNMYMTLAKGFGLGNLRFLGIFANTRVPGSAQPGFELEGFFHSNPYEGPARALNYVAATLHKWRFGNVRYMWIMNTILPKKDRVYFNSAVEAVRAYIAHRNGTLEKKFKGAQRLFDLFNFSGMSNTFGTNYTWRQIDSTVAWSDKQRELLGGALLIHLSKKFNEPRIKEYLVTNKYRNKFREEIRQAGKPDSGADFDVLWKEYGLAKYQKLIDKEWDELVEEKKVKDLKNYYQKAFIARAWVQTTLRSPLSVAHALEIEIKDKVTGVAKKRKLHNYLVQQVLGINPEDTKYSKIGGTAGAFRTPTEDQFKYQKDVLELEQDLAVVREIALSQNREIEDEDFKIIKPQKNQDQAKQYWKLTMKFILGSDDLATCKNIYSELGLSLSENGEDYELQEENINKIDNILKEKGKKTVPGLEEPVPILLNDQLVARKLDEIIFWTDDTAFRQMDLLNLGPRQLMRGAGDAAAHFHGGERVGTYLVDDIAQLGNNPEELAKKLFEVRKPYEGDAIEAGWKVTGILSTATCRFFALDYSKFASAAQIMAGTRRLNPAWTANKRRRWYDAIEHLGILPPEAEAWGYDIVYLDPTIEKKTPLDVKTLRRIDKADNIHVWREILLLGIALAVALQVYRGFTAPSEEEEGGGGGGPPH